MRILHLLAVCGLTLTGAALADPPPSSPTAQPPPPPTSEQLWLVSDHYVLFTPVPIVLPAKAGILSETNHKEASQQGENIDNAIEYWSGDRAVWATVYIYYPGLAHAGLAAIAQDGVIRKTFPQVTGGEMRLAPVGGVDRAAIRASYSHYLKGDLASEAAYVKAGRWLITVRISGPEKRRSDIVAAMDALLQGMKFGKAAPARAASLLTVRDCAPQADDKPAKALPDPQGASIAAYGFLGTFDGAGNAATDKKTGGEVMLPSRVPTELCRADLKLHGGTLTLLRGADGDPISIDGRTVRAVLLTDSGGILEVDHARNLGGYVLLYHDLGVTDVLGLYDGIPSDEQLAAIVDGTDKEGRRIRVPVHFRAGRGPEMFIPGIPSDKPSPAPAQPSTSSQ